MPSSFDCIALWNYVGGAELYRSQTARVKVSVWPLFTSGPQFHLQVQDAGSGAGSRPVRGLCRHTVRHRVTKPHLECGLKKLAGAHAT